jgi:hypothetical protein
MNTYIERLELIHWIADVQDISVLNRVKSIKENHFVEPTPEKLSIERGLNDFREGRLRSHLQVKERYEKWL